MSKSPIEITVLIHLQILLDFIYLHIFINFILSTINFNLCLVSFFVLSSRKHNIEINLLSIKEENLARGVATVEKSSVRVQALISKYVLAVFDFSRSYHVKHVV